MSTSKTHTVQEDTCFIWERDDVYQIMMTMTIIRLITNIHFKEKYE